MRQFEGGQSNPTFALKAGSREYVLRKQPPGELLPSAHQVDREYRVMHALRDSDVPVPKMYALCEDTSVIGTKFYVMEKVAGRVFTDLLLPSMNNDERRAVYKDLARVLAALHTVDHRAVGLESFGKPGNYYSRQISRWSKQYVASQTEALPAMDKLMQWLPEHTPQADETVIVHGDYRMGNVLIHPTEPRIAAVLDWELSTLGHPLADLGYVCMDYHSDSYTTAGLARPDLASFGIPSETRVHRRLLPIRKTRRDRELEVLRRVQPVPLGRDHSGRVQTRARRQREFRYRDRLQGRVPDALRSGVGIGRVALVPAAPQ